MSYDKHIAKLGRQNAIDGASKILIVLILVIVSPPSFADSCPYSANVPACGEDLHPVGYRGVIPKSNGNYQWCPINCDSVDTEYGYAYQCTEYAKRFYGEALGVTSAANWTGHGKSYYLDAAGKGLHRFPNGGTVPPQPDDVIAFHLPGVNNLSNTGHVAVVSNVTDTTVEIFEQNWSVTGRKMLDMEISDGTFTVTRSGSKYEVLGWARLPSAPGGDVIYDEQVNGDIDNTYGPSFELEVGRNTILGSHAVFFDPDLDGVGFFNTDFDVFSFALPDQGVLTSVEFEYFNVSIEPGTTGSWGPRFRLGRPEYFSDLCLFSLSDVILGNGLDVLTTCTPVPADADLGLPLTGGNGEYLWRHSVVASPSTSFITGATWSYSLTFVVE